MATIGEVLGIEIPYMSPLQFTDILMNSFALQTESVIRAEIDKFNTEGAENEVIEICPEEGIYHHFEYYCGLTSDEVMLDEIFTEYFPSLNRRSAFQTIYSTYEVELQSLCVRYREKLGGKKFKNYDGIGILKVNNFVNHRFPALKDSPEWEQINRLRILRNHCVHDDGRAYKANKRVVIEIFELINANPELFHHDGVIGTEEDGTPKTYSNGDPLRTGIHVLFEVGCLEFTIRAFEAYVKVLNDAFSQAST
ncbi:hypothetical protein LMH66_20220 [Shewanella sp. 10N.7]|uniref:hypothetical protein n=1 Tax=Shewanella sp. 10N.7 TaxID=2885093 RepID=UPI001E35B5BE|nr:hypothetical protein [Shewanella sp. 10N.7]MCC4834971.1 hypothetical protein [Shewanella sp. 10N.7]